MLMHENKMLIHHFRIFFATLDKAMIRKLAIRSLQKGIGSMDYIEKLLIIENQVLFQIRTFMVDVIPCHKKSRKSVVN